MIYVDTREHHIEDIKEILLNMPRNMVEVCPPFEFKCLGLDLGDYLIRNDHELCIERKNISDFCGSYYDLGKRLHTMRLQYEHTGLLLEGSYTLSNEMIYVLEGGRLVPRLKYETFVNIITKQSNLGTWMFRTSSLEESIYQMIFVHNYLPTLDIPKTCIKCGSISSWMTQLPGVGAGTLEKMRKKYESPIEAISTGLPKRAKDILSKWQD